MARTLFPLLVNAPEKRYVMIGEGTHTIIMEKNRMELFHEVQAFLDEGIPAERPASSTHRSRKNPDSTPRSLSAPNPAPKG